MPNPTTKTRQAIKNRFVRNAIPTQADFADLIDASLNQADDGLLKLPNEPLGLVRQQPDKPVLRFYDSPDATGSVWQIQLSADNKASADSKAGFALVNTNKDGATSTRLFLDAATGNVGIGTTQADARLTVQGGMQIADTVTIGGRVDMLATSNPIRFSSTWTGFPDDKTNGAEISNDVTGYKTLMIIGNKSAGGPRSVSIWDVLNVNGSLNVKSTLTAIGNVGIGTDVPGSKLHIVHSNQGPGGNTLILGPTNQSNLRLGYDEAYSWIQSHGSKPLAINSIENNVGIGTANPLAKLQITGNVSIVSAEGQSFACKSNYMAPGSLTIGGLDRNYGGGNNGWNTNTAGLLLEALDNTEIAIHDSGVRLASFMYYEGAKNQFTIGRDMGFGAISAVNVQGALQATKLNIFEATGTAATASAGSLLLDHNDSGGASSIVFRSKVNQGSDYAFLEYRDKNPNINDSEAGLLTIGIQNDGNDNIALMPSGNVGIGTVNPLAKLHVLGDLVVKGAVVRSIWAVSGNGPKEEADMGRLNSRTLKINKLFPETALRIVYCDNFRVFGDNVACRWEILVDGKSVNPPILADRYEPSGNRHLHGTVMGYAKGVAAGAHEIQVWIVEHPHNQGKRTDASTGWDSSTWSLEAEEVTIA